VAPSADATSLDARRRPTSPAASWRYGWPLQLVNTITVATYVLAGVAKLSGPLGWRWAHGSSLRNQVAVDGIRKYALDGTRPGQNRAVDLLERWPCAWQLLAVGSLALELGAPIALVDRRVGRLWAVAAWSMHGGIKSIMKINFRYQLSGIPYAPFFNVERLVCRPARGSIEPPGFRGV